MKVVGYERRLCCKEMKTGMGTSVAGAARRRRSTPWWRTVAVEVAGD